MVPRPLRLASLLAALPALACGGGSHAPAWQEPREARATCPAPAVVSGGPSGAADLAPACFGPPAPSALPPVPAATHGWRDLGEHAVGEEVVVEVPAGTASLTLVEQLVSGGPATYTTLATFTGSGATVRQPNVAVVGRLHDPAGRLVYDDLRLIGGAEFPDDLLAPGGSGAVVGTVTFPSTSAGLAAVGGAGVPPGPWRALVNDYAYECWLAADDARRPPGLAGMRCDAESAVDTSRYQLYALTTPSAAGAGAIPARGALDLALHLVDTPEPGPLLGLTSATAPDHPGVRRMLSTLAGLFANAGICLGTVTFHDAPDWARAELASATSPDDPVPCGNLSRVLAMSRAGSATLDLFLLPYLLQPAGGAGRVIGVDGTIPGPATVNGTVASGAVVVAQDLISTARCGAGGPDPMRCGPDRVAFVAAHEAGHFLGLYHPTEADGTTFDPLHDTPHCECSSRCGFSDFTGCAAVDASACLRPDPRCAGGANLMFWQLGPPAAGALSPEQARIVRASPLVRPL